MAHSAARSPGNLLLCNQADADAAGDMVAVLQSRRGRLRLGAA